ncbi:MAG: zinc-binding alcohol dehydrogenase [Armatimonadetes bacterium]|nr:zinc-binding alcohol dehydrogenase [Armatimonadota bacterium]
MKSLAVYFAEPRKVEVREEEVGEPGPGQVLTRTRVSLLSTGTEMWCYRGEFDEGTTWANWVHYPFRPGYQNVGEVVAVGEGVEALRTGDRVFVGAGHAGYVLSDATSAVKVPQAVSDEDAAWAALSFIAQTGVRRANHSMGDTAVVIGLGPLGQMVVQYLKVIGLREILAIDTVQLRLDAALAHGATAAFCGSAADARDFVLEHTGGMLADVVYDVTGHYTVLPMALKLARDFGVVELIGDTPHPSKQHLTQDILARQVTLIGTHNAKLGPGAYWTPQRQIELFYLYVSRGQMKAADLITHSFRPDQAAECYRLLETDRGSTIGVMFDWRE